MNTDCQTMQESILHIMDLAIQHAFPDVQEKHLEVVQSTNAQFGHYQCNSALKLGKELKKNPRVVAELIMQALSSIPAAKGLFQHVEIAGPGFINITLLPEFLSRRIDAMLQDERLGVPSSKQKKKVIVEFSSPNIAKELHVGHLRSTIIGDCLARTFEFLGEEVLRLNHVGDWGTQFGMLICYLQEYHPKVLSGEEKTDLPHLMEWYRASKKCFDEDPDFKKRSQLQVVRLQSQDPQTIQAWQMICAISRIAFQEIYDLMDVKLQERGESFYNPYLLQVISDLEAKGLITVSDGAKCVFLDGFVTREGTPLPMIVQKSDGGYNYDTTDMAAVWHRVHVEKADRIIIVTDAGQSLHFQMVFQAAAKVGYYDPSKVTIDHVPFGVVLGPDGKKFKTRSGETEKLIDLLLGAVSKAKQLIDERLPDLPEQEREQLAKVLGIGAVKYADLSCHRIKDYVFSYDRMLRFEGNTAAFLLYAYVRILGIQRKSKKDMEKVLASSKVSLVHPSEIALGLHLSQFGEALQMVAKDLLPNRLTDYLYELAEKFHAFYRDCRVEGVEEEESRLLLSEAAARTLRQGLHILGLQVISRM